MTDPHPEVHTMRRLLSIVLTALLAAAVFPGQVAAVGGIPTTVTFTQSPGTTEHGVAFAAQPVVHVLDDTAAALAGASVTLTIKSGTGAGSAHLTCTANTVVTDTNGDATFSGCSIDLVGTGYVLTATAVVGVDTASGDSSSFDVTPGAATQLAVVTQPSTTVTAGSSLGSPQVAIEDAAGNVITTDNTTDVTVALTSAAGATLHGTLTATASSGVVTFPGLWIDKVGSYTLTASSGVLTSAVTNSISVGPGAPASLSATGFPATAAGVSNDFTVTVVDAYGNTTPDYLGTVTFTSSDPQAVLPPDSQITPNNFGSRTFSAALRTAGSQSITVTDTVTASITGTQSGIAVSPAAAATLAVSAGTSQVATVAFPVSVTAHDAFGNVATGYTGTIHVTSSDGAATLPSDHTFTGVDAGIAGVNVTLATPGSATVTATDTASSSITGTSATITVSATGSTTQTVSFAIANQIYPVASPITAAASSTSGLSTFVYSVPVTTSVCTVSSNLVTVIAAGTCQVHALQPGNSTYAPASADASFSVAKGSQTITITSTPPARGVSGQTYTPAATATSGLAVTVTVHAGSETSCSSSGGLVTFGAGGTCQLDFTQGGNANWNAATTTQAIAVDAAPVCAAASVSITMNVDGQGTASCSDADTDPLTYAVGTPSHGTVSIAGGVWTYHSNVGYAGPDAFALTANDGYATSAPATITVTVTDSSPVAYPDVVSVAPVNPTAISVLANDSAGAGDTGQPLTITGLTAARYGRVSVVGSTVVYDPTGCFVSAGTTDLFTYTVSDGRSSSTTAVVVTVVRPGQAVTAPAATTLSPYPVTDTPSVALTTGVLTSAAPVRVAWCGVVGTALRSYGLLQSSDGGLTYPAVYSGTSASATRGLVLWRTYGFKARTTDTSGRSGISAASPLVRAVLTQDSQTSTIRFGGTWSIARSSLYSGGTERYTTRTTAYATYTVVGARGFAIVTSKGIGRGSVRVYVDGKYIATVSERASFAQYKRIIFARGLSYGPTTSHTIKVVPYGYGRVDLDAIVTLR